MIARGDAFGDLKTASDVRQPIKGRSHSARYTQRARLRPVETNAGHLWNTVKDKVVTELIRYCETMADGTAMPRCIYFQLRMFRAGTDFGMEMQVP